MAELTPQGLVIRSFDEIQASIESDLSTRFKALGFDTIDLTPQSVFGQFVGITTEAIADSEALAQAIYFSQYPDFASNLSLDLASELTNTRRIAATRTAVQAIVYGLDGAVITALSQAADSGTGALYQVDNAITISKASAVYARIAVSTVATGVYTATINSTIYSFTASGGSTEANILTGLASAIGSVVNVVNTGGRLVLTSVTPFTLTVTGFLLIEEVGTQATFYALLKGATPLPVGALTQIATPLTGWTRVNNLAAGVAGLARESDEALRVRRARNVDNSILGAIEQLENVTDIKVKENDTAATDSDGTLRQTLWVIVEGGDNTAIATTLLKQKPAGIGTRGAISTNVVSPVTGGTTAVRFDRPTYVEPGIRVSYSRLAGFPPDGEAQIKAALVAYGATLKIGETLFFSRLFTPINTVPGMTVTVTTATTVGGSYSAQNIPATTGQKIRILAANIALTDVT